MLGKNRRRMYLIVKPTAFLKVLFRNAFIFYCGGKLKMHSKDPPPLLNDPCGVCSNRVYRVPETKSENTKMQALAL